MNKIHQYTIELSDLKKPIEITISFDYDPESPDFDYGTEHVNQKEMSRFESGELLNLYIVVEAKIGHLAGHDSLGQVFVKASNLEQDVMDTVKAYDMIQNAIDDLKLDIERTKQLLNEVM